MPPRFYRLYLKLASKRVENKPQLRQLFVELCRALYPYPEVDALVRNAMIKKSLDNLKEKNEELFDKLVLNDMETILGHNVLKKSYFVQINQVIDDSYRH